LVDSSACESKRWNGSRTPHPEKRTEDRDFTEIDLRGMLAGASGYRPGVVPDRFVVETRHRGRGWEVIVEPDEPELLLVVVTVYPIDRWRDARPLSRSDVPEGRALAAYLYLPRPPGVRSVRTEDLGRGLLTDYDAAGHVIGLEITAPRHTTADEINTALERLGQSPIDPEEIAPLRAAW
jgi:uncharacterized protein YuzE